MSREDMIEAWLARQDAAVRQGVESLRAIVWSLGVDWTESIKWNAPSFAVDGTDRLTLGVMPRGSWRLVLHRGAKASTDDFAFTDVTGLAAWPASDRGVIQFRTMAEIEAAREPLARLIRDWIEQDRT